MSVRVAQNSKLERYIEGSRYVSEIVFHRKKAEKVGMEEWYEISLEPLLYEGVPATFATLPEETPYNSFFAAQDQLCEELTKVLDLGGFWKHMLFKRLKFAVEEDQIGLSGSIKCEAVSFVTPKGEPAYTSLTLPKMLPDQVAKLEQTERGCQLHTAIWQFHNEVLSFLAGDRAIKHLPVQQLALEVVQDVAG